MLLFNTHLCLSVCLQSAHFFDMMDKMEVRTTFVLWKLNAFDVKGLHIGRLNVNPTCWTRLVVGCRNTPPPTKINQFSTEGTGAVCFISTWSPGMHTQSCYYQYSLQRQVGTRADDRPVWVFRCSVRGEKWSKLCPLFLARMQQVPEAAEMRTVPQRQKARLSICPSSCPSSPTPLI